MHTKYRSVLKYLLSVMLVLGAEPQADEKTSKFDSMVANIFLVSCFQQKYDDTRFLELMSDPKLGVKYRGITKIPKSSENEKVQYANAHIWTMDLSNQKIDIIFDESRMCSVSTSDLEEKDNFLHLFEEMFKSYGIEREMKVVKVASDPNNSTGITEEYSIARKEGYQKVMLSLSTSEKNVMDVVISTY